MTAQTPDIKTILEQAKHMQIQMENTQKKLAELIVTGEAHHKHKEDGKEVTFTIKVRMNGHHEVLDITVHPSLEALLRSSGGTALLLDLIVAAFNDAVKKIEEISRKELQKITQGIDINFDEETE